MAPPKPAGSRLPAELRLTEYLSDRPHDAIWYVDAVLIALVLAVGAAVVIFAAWLLASFVLSGFGGVVAMAAAVPLKRRNTALLHDLAKTAPKTALAVDRPMTGAKDLLDYRTQQVEALVETSAGLERDRARLIANAHEMRMAFSDSRDWPEDWSLSWHDRLINVEQHPTVENIRRAVMEQHDALLRDLGEEA